jgi:DNA polymerase I-like protein with 3'-5' exonuclease and polymerase domains
MEAAGFSLDTGALDEEIDNWASKLADARNAWTAATGEAPPEKPQQIRDWLLANLEQDVLETWPRTKITQELSTAASDLERAAHLPAVRPLLDIKRLEKLLSSFGPSLRGAVHPITGRVHANYQVAGAKSGRWSCRSPNLQQIPGGRLAPGFRSVFKAPPGRLLIGADYSQMEMRAAAEISGDPALKQIYKSGLDIHRITAAAMAGVTEDEVTKEQRSRAKPVNFGSIYGMGAAGLAVAAWNGYRVEMTRTEAARALAAFFRKFHRLQEWMRSHADKCQQRHRIAIGAGRVVEDAWEPYGIRYTQCCNLPVQGACADAMMRAVKGVHSRIHTEQMDAVIVAQIHDEVLLEVTEQDAAVTQTILEEEMVAAFVATFPDAPVLGLVEVKAGPSWAEMNRT